MVSERITDGDIRGVKGNYLHCDTNKFSMPTNRMLSGLKPMMLKFSCYLNILRSDYIISHVLRQTPK